MPQFSHPRRIVWREIPSADPNRATRFYQSIFQVTLHRETAGPSVMAILPDDQPAMSGPGPILYLNADPSLDQVLGRVESAGGKVVLPRTELPPGMGVFARIEDPEGNTVGLHAMA